MVAETVKKLRWEPAIIHCQGWISALAPIYLKRIYADDPTFSSSKIVYSLLGDSFEGTLDSRMAEKLAFEGFSAEDIKSLTSSDSITHKELTRLAIDYADGIVHASADADPELVEYARASGKPFLPLPEEPDFATAYDEFYKSL